MPSIQDSAHALVAIRSRLDVAINDAAAPLELFVDAVRRPDKYARNSSAYVLDESVMASRLGPARDAVDGVQALLREATPIVEDLGRWDGTSELERASHAVGIIDRFVRRIERDAAKLRPDQTASFNERTAWYDMYGVGLRQNRDNSKRTTQDHLDELRGDVLARFDNIVAIADRAVERRPNRDIAALRLDLDRRLVRPAATPTEAIIALDDEIDRAVGALQASTRATLDSLQPRRFHIAVDYVGLAAGAARMTDDLDRLQALIRLVEVAGDGIAGVTDDTHVARSRITKTRQFVERMDDVAAGPTDAKLDRNLGFSEYYETIDGKFVQPMPFKTYGISGRFDAEILAKDLARATNAIGESSHRVVTRVGREVDVMAGYDELAAVTPAMATIDAPPVASLAGAVVDARSAQGLSRERVAELAGLQVDDIDAVERGDATMVAFARYANALGLEVRLTST